MSQATSIAYIEETQPFPKFVDRGKDPSLDRRKMQLDYVAVHLKDSHQMAAANSKESYNREVGTLREELREANEYNQVLTESLQLAAEEYEQIRRMNEFLEAKCERSDNVLPTSYKYVHIKEMYCEQDIATLMSKNQMLLEHLFSKCNHSEFR